MSDSQVIFSSQFLDCLSSDMPKGCWSIQQTRDLVTVRSFLWNGYMAYCQGSLYGGIYFGNGLKNSDLPFILNKY